MNTNTVLLLGAAGVGVFLITRRGGSGSGYAASGGSKSGFAAAFTNLRTNAAKGRVTAAVAGSLPATGGSAIIPSAPSVGGRDLASAGGAVAAGAGCAAIPGAQALAPLCGSAGAYIGGKAYDYGERAYNEIASWF